MSVYKELIGVCKDWKPAASFSSLSYSLSSKPAERLADPTHCVAPLCLPRFQTVVAGDVREPYLVSASSYVCLSFSHSLPAPNQGSRIQAVSDVVIYNKACLFFT